MGSSAGLGIFAVLLGGVFQGSVFVPMKLSPRWNWENTWVCFSAVAYLISPWMLACLLVSGFPQMLREISPHILVAALLLGAGMGVGALMMGLAYTYVGMAITFAIVLGIASSIGTLVPLLVLAPSEVMRPQGLLVIAGVVIALVGTGVVSWAAWERDSDRKLRGKEEGSLAGSMSARGLLAGLALCIGSGVLSSCGNLGFAFGSQISQRAQELGAGHTGSASALWAVILFPVFLCNMSYGVYLLRKNKTVRLFREPGTAHYWGWGILMGIDWMAGMAAYGAGALSLGKLGTSMGWILFMASMIAVANLLGVLTGEWKGASRRALSIMALGIVILLASIIVVGGSGR